MMNRPILRLSAEPVAKPSFASTIQCLAWSFFAWACVTASSADGALTIAPGLGGQLTRNHDSYSLWHQPNGGCCINVGDTVFFPRQETRSYAIFDLTPVTSEVSSGNLRMTMPATSFWSNYNDTNAEGVAMYDIGTNLNTLTGLTTAPWGVYGATGIPIHTDLGTGALYGSTTVGPQNFNQVVSIPLTAQAIADINSAAGTAMGIGFNGTTGRMQLNSFTSPRLVLFTFGEPVAGGGGIDFRLDEGEISGAGEVDIRPRGVDHHLNAHALGGQTMDQKFSEVRRRFTFTSGSPDPASIVLSGALDGTLYANEGIAGVVATLEIYDTVTGQRLANDSFSRMIDVLFGEDEINESIDEALRLNVDLQPGRTYEMISRLNLSASILGPLGRADALFGNTFSVNLSSVPEPGGIALLTVAALVLASCIRVSHRDSSHER